MTSVTVHASSRHNHSHYSSQQQERQERYQRSRRLGKQKQQKQQKQQQQQKESQTSSSDDFYDLTLLTNDELLREIKPSDVAEENLPHEIDTTADTTATLVDGNDDAYNGKTDDTLDDNNGSRDGTIVAYSDNNKKKKTEESNNYLETRSSRPQQQQQQQRSLRKVELGILPQPRSDIDKAVFDAYEYSNGACPNAGSLGVPCAPNDLPKLCNKYGKKGSFRECLNACKPAFCCIHDAPPSNNPNPNLSDLENCNTDENCAQYNYCYIAWWKLHDTVGPALFLRVEQDDEFYDVDAGEIESDSTGDTFFTQLLLHHFDDINQVIQDGTEDNEFNADRIFLDEDYWVYPVTGEVDING
ncbi:hypothetical protein ACHAXR_005684 [Thalassiosira sp. AJA248-18]